MVRSLGPGSLVVACCYKLHIIESFAIQNGKYVTWIRLEAGEGEEGRFFLL